MFPVPRLHVAKHVERHAVAEFELTAHVIVERGDVCRADRRRLRIVLRVPVERIHVRTAEARVQAPGSLIGVVLQHLLELASVDAQVRLVDVGNRQPSVLMQLLLDRFFLRRIQRCTGGERDGVVGHREFLDFGEKRLEFLRRIRQLLVIPRRRRVGRQRKRVALIDARIELRRIDVVAEGEYLR